MKLFNSPAYSRVVTAIMVLVVVPIIAWLFWPGQGESSSLALLSQVGLVRGLITFFILLVVAAVAISIVIFALFYAKAEDKDRFGMAKEVLTIFVGLLGTLMGFYFTENRVSPENVQKIAETLQQPQTASVGEFEKKGFDALIAKDFDAASKAFAEANRINPTWHNVAEINKLFNSQKDPFTSAVASKDESKKAEVWKNIYCTIDQKQTTAGMTAEMIASIKKSCGAANTAANANTAGTPGATNSQAGTNVSNR